LKGLLFVGKLDFFFLRSLEGFGFATCREKFVSSKATLKQSLISVYLHGLVHPFFKPQVYVESLLENFGPDRMRGRGEDE
jgi:hypothetical protein